MGRKITITWFFLCFMFSGLYAQNELRCDLVGERCIDLAAVNGQTITVPSNTTRIARDQLNICGDAFQVRDPVDIVIVVDQSGSMAYNDSTYYSPIAASYAVQKIAEINNASAVGLVPFAGGNCTERAPLALTTAENFTTVLGWIASDIADGNGAAIDPSVTYDPNNWQTYEGLRGTIDLECRMATPDDEKFGTQYTPALSAAETLVQAGPNQNKAIIFITDGNPNDNSQFNSWVNQGGHPPVYSIRIDGTMEGDNARTLIDLGEETGGGYFPVEANATAQLDEVVLAIINNIFITAQPTWTQVQNITNGQTAIADGAANHISNGGRSFRANLDDIVSLNPGLNSIKVTSRQEQNGVQDTKETSFIIDVSGPASTAGDFELPDSLFNIECVEPSDIYATNENYNIIQSISFEADQLGVLLNTPSGVPSAMVTITSQVTGDSETLPLSQLDPDSFRELFNFTRGAAVAGDGTIQSGPNDVITITWVHPRDPRDIATVSINVTAGPVAEVAEKIPSDFKKYIVAGTGEIKTFPDTVLVRVSEPLVPRGNVQDPWTDLFLFFKDCQGDPIPVQLEAVPTVSEDGLTWTLYTRGDASNFNLGTGDCIILNPNADYQEMTSTPELIPVGGRDSKLHEVSSILVRDVIGSDKEETYVKRVNDSIPVIDVDAGWVVVDHRTAGEIVEWIPPVTLDETGNVNNICTDSSLSAQEPVRALQNNCLSLVAVHSAERYTATVNIFDHLGKFIHASQQNFGYCGELAADNRQDPAGYKSFLVWNQKDDNGQFVGSGVYIWKVLYRFENGKTYEKEYRQGIAREATPTAMCWSM